jgi:glycosyltransferase involved in cell wall biosynthesis
MKIVQVTPYFHPHIGGVESHVLGLSRELVDRGHEVHVLTAKLPNTRDKEIIEGIHVERTKPWFIWFKTPVMPKIWKAILAVNGDVVHAHSPPPLPSYYCSKACRVSKTPFVITYHCDLELSSVVGRFVTELYRRTYGASTIKRADDVIVTTNTYAATSRTVWNADPVVIPNMVDIERFKPRQGLENRREGLRLAGDRPIVLFVGRLTRHKGVEYLLKASKDIDAMFLIVGEGEHGGYFRGIARNLKVEKRVRFLGRIPDGTITEYLSAADVLVLPSTSRLEAFGIAALEAMASGTPVVISDIPGVREVITDGKEGLLAEPMNPRSLVEKISLILNDEEMRKSMGALARKKVEAEFSVEKVVDRIEGVYQKVAGGQGN